MESAYRGLFLTLLYCVTLVKSLSLSEPPYLHQYNKRVALHGLYRSFQLVQQSRNLPGSRREGRWEVAAAASARLGLWERKRALLAAGKGRFQ